jgi:hypothetical protein
MQAGILRQIRILQRSHGISEAQIRVIERAREKQLLPPSDDRFWRTQVERAPATDNLDDAAESGFERLMNLVDPKWLSAEAQKPYRLDSAFLANPLHLVNGVRVGMSLDDSGPQRFARMLLVCQDHLMKRWNLDFFSAAICVPEVAALGNSLDEIAALGPEAERKLLALPEMTADQVSATIYELLVGAACIRHGLNLMMVPEDRSRKVPDFRIPGLGPFTGAIECKRRLGLTTYELGEARRVEGLYSSVRSQLHQDGIHGSLEASFRVPLQSVPEAQFIELAMAAICHEGDQEQAAWGSVVFRRLVFNGSLSATRLYSPDYLQRVFDWDVLQDQWDGLLCEVEIPSRVDVEMFRMPMCLKWRSESEEALRKKARGITSLWGDAVKQIPDGEIGAVYIAYPEGARPALADARTRHILQSAMEFWHRWSVRVPFIVISRLYARSLGPGTPDLIESALPGAAEGQEHWLTTFPHRVFTGQRIRTT